MCASRGHSLDGCTLRGLGFTRSPPPPTGDTPDAETAPRTRAANPSAAPRSLRPTSSTHANPGPSTVRYDAPPALLRRSRANGPANTTRVAVILRCSSSPVSTLAVTPSSECSPRSLPLVFLTLDSVRTSGPNDATLPVKIPMHRNIAPGTDNHQSRNAHEVTTMQPKRNTAKRDLHRAAIARTQPPCGICGHTIDYTLTYPHAQSYVVDHITSLYAGGTDTLDNKQAAHRGCNSAKGRRDIPPIIKRSSSLRWGGA